MITARLTIDSEQRIGPVRRRLFGGFVEHVGRHIYGGIYEPGHPSADERGFRRDVIELVRELGVSTIRYPGGNFVSGHRWEDGVGPRELRPRRLDLAWHSTETNEVGLHEFSDWLGEVGSELMLALNLGTRGTLEALELLEYANFPGGTALSDARAHNGRPEPFDVRMWCLGNEMDGPWQIGHRSADDYGKLAAQTARAMRRLDPHLELVVCGSSASSMPTFGQWEKTVLAHTYDEVDYISCHAYYEQKDGDLGSFLASSVDMDRFIEKVAGIADEVRAAKGSDKRIDISFDEWNVWYLSRHEQAGRPEVAGHWPVAPRLLEDVYSVADGVVVGSLLICLLRHADRVASASLAQLVNAIAPIMTETSGPAWRQTTFFPFALTSRLASGEVLRLESDAPEYETVSYGSVPVLDAVATHDADSGRAALFLVNRSQTDRATVTIDARALGGATVRSARTLADDDFAAANTLREPDRVGLRHNRTVSHDGGFANVIVPPVSWTALELA